MMRNKEAEMSFLNSANAYFAYTGTDLYEGNAFTDMASLACFSTNYMHFVILASKAKEGTITDLNGLRYSAGAAGSGSEVNFRIVADAVGLNIKRESLGFNAQKDAMINGLLDGGSYDAAYPVPAVSELYATPGTNVQILRFTQEQVDKVNEFLPNFLTLQEIPANTYSGQSEAIPVATYSNLLVGSKDMDDELVYTLLTILYDNLDYMTRVHVSCADMKLDTALDGVSIPLHPGAVKFYQEKGIKIPDVIMPVK
jgi:TRAP transporter TAXI family solute receptor